MPERLDINPKDGYSAELYENKTKNRIQIWIMFRVCGELQNKTLVVDWENDVKSRGEASRRLLLYQAACRYLSTGGGNWNFVEILDDLRRLKAEDKITQLAMPEGWFLVNSSITGDATFEHVYANDEIKEAIHVSEGIFVEQLSYADYIHWQEVLSEIEQNECVSYPAITQED